MSVMKVTGSFAFQKNVSSSLTEADPATMPVVEGFGLPLGVDDNRAQHKATSFAEARGRASPDIFVDDQGDAPPVTDQVQFLLEQVKFATRTYC